jgi:hypothetical protein
MKILKLVLIISTILTVFTRSHYRRSQSSSKGIKGFFDWIVEQITPDATLLFDKINKVMTEENKFVCTAYKELLTGVNIKKMIKTSKVQDVCELKCDGWSGEQQREFEEIVSYSLKISDKAYDRVPEFIHWLGKRNRRWAWQNCFPSRKLR